MATHDENIVNRLKKRVIAFENKEVSFDVQNGKYILK
jgi:ABC-type ATPase involved in cell division